MKLRSGRKLLRQLSSSIRKPKASSDDKRKPFAPLHEFRAIVPDFGAISTEFIRPPPQDLMIPPPPPEYDDIRTPLPIQYLFESSLQRFNRELRTPPPHQGSSCGGIYLTDGVLDSICGALQR